MRVDRDKYAHAILCPECTPDDVREEWARRRRWWTTRGYRMRGASEGRTDIVRCPSCSHEEPRFVEVPDPPKRQRRRGGPKPKRPWRGEGADLTAADKRRIASAEDS